MTRAEQQNERERLAHRGMVALAAAFECDPAWTVGRFTPSVKCGRRYLSVTTPDGTTFLATLEVEGPE